MNNTLTVLTGVFSTEEIKNPLNDCAKYFKEAEDARFFLVDTIGNAAAQAVQENIYEACRSAETIQLERAYMGVIPSARDYDKEQE